MARWYIDRIINIDERKTQLLLKAIHSNRATSADFIESFITAHNLEIGGLSDLKRHGKTFLKSHGLLYEKKEMVITPIGLLYKDKRLSKKTFVMLQLLKKYFIINGNIISPICIITMVLLHEEISYITKAEFAKYIVCANDMKESTVIDICDKISYYRKSPTGYSNNNEEHEDIWFNYLNTSGLFYLDSEKKLHIAKENKPLLISSVNTIINTSSELFTNENYCSLDFIIKDIFPKIALFNYPPIHLASREIEKTILINLLVNNYDCKTCEEILGIDENGNFVKSILKYLAIVLDENAGRYSLLQNYPDVVSEIFWSL